MQELVMDDTIIENATALGVSVTALWIVSKRLWKAIDDHMASYQERVNALEVSARECNTDREELHRKHSLLQSDVIEKLTDLANKGR